MTTSIGASDLSVFIVEPSAMQARIVQQYLDELGVSNIQLFKEGGCCTGCHAQVAASPADQFYVFG